MRLLLGSSLALVILGAACSKRDGDPEPPVAMPASAETAAATAPTDGAASAAGEARAIYDSRCRNCHGPAGKGDGPAASSLNPPPRDYTDRAWQATVSDDDLARVIRDGGAAAGKSTMMPPAPDLKDRPEVVAALVAMIRSFGQ